MSRTAQKCPVCEGLGRIYTGPNTIVSPSTAPHIPDHYYKMCNACSGTGIVWEPSTPGIWPPSYPSDPNTPFVPRPPTFVPNEVPGLTFPEDFEFPEDIKKASEKKLADIVNDWLSILSDENRLEIFNKYCTHCGSKDPKCQCWNDE